MSVLNYKTLEQMTVEELRRLAAERNIELKERMRKRELIEAILDWESEHLTEATAELPTTPKVGIEKPPVEVASLEQKLSAPSPSAGEGRGDQDEDAVGTPAGATGDGEKVSPPPPTPSIPVPPEEKPATPVTNQEKGDGSSGRVRAIGDDFEEETAVLEKEEEEKKKPQVRVEKGILDYPEKGNYGFMRQRQFKLGEEDIYVSMSLIRKFKLRTGDLIEGRVRPPREKEHFSSLIHIDTIFGIPVTKVGERPQFAKLTPIYPDQRIILETNPKEISTRLIDLFAPIGRGQRGIIVAKPKAGKTTMLKKIADAVAKNHPDIHLIALLIDERPEEVTDFERSIKGEVISSTFDEAPENHIKVAELTLEYAKRMVEMGKDVMILLDSLTRLARAYNLTCPPSGKTLSGGLDPNSLQQPKRFLGAARNIENGGSLTILCTALIETGSKLDDIIYEEFKGTANMELHLKRELADQRIFPAIDIIMSGTRHEELLYDPEEMQLIWTLRKMLADMEETERMNRLINRLLSTQSNAELLMIIKRAAAS